MTPQLGDVLLLACALPDHRGHLMRPHLLERHHEVADPHVTAVFAEVLDASVMESERRAFVLDARPIAYRPALRDIVVVQEGLVRRIHAAIETLEPAAALERLGYESMCRRHTGPFHGWWARFLLGWSHVRPDNAAHVDCRVC